MSAKRITIDSKLLRQYSSRSKKRAPKKIRYRILIVCEGIATEPNYFRSIERKYGAGLVYELTIQGEGANTVQVVDKAIELQAKASPKYDSVWAVFDKDSFTDNSFNAAIRKAKSNGIECAWSNEAFELWYLYHFHNRVTAMSRTEYKKSISDAVNRSEQYRERKTYQYEKNATDTLDILQKYGSQDNAIKWAEAQSLTFTDTKFAKHNPCTMVFKLVRQLIGEDEAFNKLVKEKIESAK